MNSNEGTVLVNAAGATPVFADSTDFTGTSPGYEIQDYSTLPISNDFMFGLVMSEPERCRAFLEQILNIKIDHVEIIERQKGIDEKVDARSIRLDIYVDDGKTVYDCEMQTTGKLKLRKRSRYYQSQIDMSLLKHSVDYTKLKPCFVIFICTFDMFNQGRYIYRFENICTEDHNLKLEDGAIKVFVNTKGTVGDVSEEFKELMHFLDTSEIKEYSNQLVNDMVAELEKARSNEEWRKEFMSIELLKFECEARGEARGEDRLSRLIAILCESNKTEDIKRVSLDSEYRKQMLAAYAL